MGLVEYRVVVIHVIGGLPGFVFTGLNASLKDCLAGVSGSNASDVQAMTVDGVQ